MTLLTVSYHPQNQQASSATDKIYRLEGGGTVRRPATAIRRNKFVELLVEKDYLDAIIRLV